MSFLLISLILYIGGVLRQEKYDRQKAKEYAKKWAYGRNPRYYDFDDLGGDCTNFVSQCIYEGSKIMNYTKNTGWYYNSINSRSPSWTGVEFLSKFLKTNKSVGPRAREVQIDEIEIGDIAQLSFNGTSFTHTVIIVNLDKKLTLDNIYIACHTYDSYNRRISSYSFEKIRFIHIDGIWKW